MPIPFRSLALPAIVAVAAACVPARAGGILTPLGAPGATIEIRDHSVDVVINNGFARTEVIQTFFNPGDVDLEAIYSFPVPRSASLSEFSIIVGERELHGEVLAKDAARTAYEEERDNGADTGLGEKNSYLTFDFLVSPVRAGSETGVRFVYYQPIEIDTGMGRYVYPLADGGTDEIARSFWTTNDTVEGDFSVNVELKSVWPVSEIRVPGFQSDVQVDALDESGGHHRILMHQRKTRLDRDFVLYYKLADDLPGRVELLTHRDGSGAPGTFMMVLTPGLDLPPLTSGADFLFVLDVSGSMNGGKIRTLTRGVGQAIGGLDPADRFRIVTFNSSARDLTGGWIPATPERVEKALGRLEKLVAGGSTNLFAGLKLATKRLDDDRATSVVIVTDAVTNTGVVDPAAFRKLMKRYDLRLFGFLIGNGANWPLMQTICEATGGFYTRVSTADDVLGQVLLAKSRITHECLHDAQLSVRGVKVWGTTGEAVGKVYRGQQLVLFGRYDEPGEATVTLEAALSGEDRTYRTTFAFPEIDETHPEIERLWALSRIEEAQTRADAGLSSPGEVEQIVTGLGVEYQIVTDHTSMLVLDDVGFERRGIDRHNRDRVAGESAARSRRAGQALRVVDDGGSRMFAHGAPSVAGGGGGGGGGAIDPITGAIAIGLGATAVAAARRRRNGVVKAS